ncbi:prenyltransferase/squalene oxidase repeat-containing protein [Aeoliella sp. SH292]|uniref:prenyltransferase/squalene oxidase repeat-containing protein n=1 Tax=Aeoliella sp. SH292 TaxID=3454464 RepID=UPI003F97663C
MTTLLEPNTAELPALDPGVDACACPDCGMPMAIRLWLRSADCLRCGTSIALEYLAVADPARATKKSLPTPTTPPPDVTPEITARELALAETIDFSSLDVSAPPKVRSRTKKLLRSLNQLLAVLMSLVTHLLLLILLALLGWGDFMKADEAINLSVVFDTNERAGDELNESIETVGFNVPIDPPDEAEEIEAERWAEQLAIEDPADAPNLPPLDRVAENLTSDDKYRRMLAARDPRIRRQIVEAEGGTNLTEAAVARALDWMARHQHEDGRWSLDEFHRAGDCNGQCGHAAGMHSDAGATAMVLQAMLGAGQTHRTGRYQDEVSLGLRYLVDAQKGSGNLASGSSHNAAMYAHALATIALCDAYALTGDETFRDPAQLAVNYLSTAQRKDGGWRYTADEPNDGGDLSVTGWQLMALHSARASGLRVEPSVLARADRFLNAVQADRQGSMYAYMPGHGESAAMTAEGLLSRIYLGWKQDEPGLRRGVRELVRRYPVNTRDTNIYYWYYATQLLHHWGGSEWREWNAAMSDALVTSQIQHGHAAGSWDPNDPHGHQGGRLYMTVLATCTLEVYYRHAPLFRKIQLVAK